MAKGVILSCLFVTVMFAVPVVLGLVERRYRSVKPKQLHQDVSFSICVFFASFS